MDFSRGYNPLISWTFHDHFFFIKIRFSCNKTSERHFYIEWVSPIFWLQENLILMKKMVKKCYYLCAKSFFEWFGSHVKVIHVVIRHLSNWQKSLRFVIYCTGYGFWKTFSLAFFDKKESKRDFLKMIFTWIISNILLQGQ